MKGDIDFMFTREDRLKAVYTTDLDSLLQSIGMLDSFSHGEVTCHYCQKTITKENLYALLPIDTSVEFCCNKPACVLAMTKEAK